MYIHAPRAEAMRDSNCLLVTVTSRFFCACSLSTRTLAEGEAESSSLAYRA
jgi:hypothetical protein